MAASISAARTFNTSHAQRFLPFAANTVFAIALVTLTDILSPIYPRVFETWYSDQYIFELTGKMWAEGGVPYVDFWDQKGPLIFLFNMIGWKITSSGFGIFLLTIIWSAITINILYLIAKEFTPVRCKELAAVLIAWISALWIGILCAPSWNLIEPLCLPFLALSTLFLVRCCNSQKKAKQLTIPWGHALTYGLSFSICLLSRLTNALSVCICALVLAIALMLHKQWMELLKCALMFIAGVAIPLLPFCVYFIMHNAFQDFIFGTLLFNMSYAGNASGLLSAPIGTKILVLCLPLLMIAFSIVNMAMNRAADILNITLLLSGSAFVMLFVKLAAYQHYAAVAAVFVPILLGQMTNLMQHRWQIVVASVCALAMLAGYQANVSNKLIWSEETYNEPELEQVIERANGSIVLYNVLVGGYLQYNLKPIYRFAWLQDWEASFNAEYKRMLNEEFASAKAEYIVLQPQAEEPAIKDVLESKYQPIKEITIEGFPATVYQRK